MGNLPSVIQSERVDLACDAEVPRGSWSWAKWPGVACRRSADRLFWREREITEVVIRLEGMRAGA